MDLNPLIVNGVFTLAGVIIGSAFPFIKELITLQVNKKMEFIRLHDKEKIEAYKELFVFVRNLSVITLPDNENIFSEYLDYYKKQNVKVIPNYPYFSKKIRDQLNELEALYQMTIINVEWITSPEKEIEDKLPGITNILQKIVEDEFKNWNY